MVRAERETTTLRAGLDAKGFDWQTGKIIYHKTKSDYEGSSCGWDDAVSAKYIKENHPILDIAFYAGYGGPECPRFVAIDSHAIYFPGTYDGATWIVRIELDLDKYLDFKNFPTPYVGGG